MSAEIEQLDAVADLASSGDRPESKSGGGASSSRPARSMRKVKRVNYAEPSTKSKLRRGDVLFPKVDAADKKGLEQERLAGESWESKSGGGASSSASGNVVTSRPARSMRKVKLPASYAEPSTKSKLRRGDVLFPKVDAADKKKKMERERLATEDAVEQGSSHTAENTSVNRILLLGMSRPLVSHPAPSVELVAELVRRHLLNQIDGRDLARVLALEANNDMLAYTVSKERGESYDQRHLHADFNYRTLVPQMQREWGESVRFSQVFLDYFWMPWAWIRTAWQPRFFNENIPRLVTENLLDFGDLEYDSIFVSASDANTTEDFISSTAAVVYLPFCSHILNQVVASYDTLKQYFAIRFLPKDQLDEHTLWKATNTISPDSMQEEFGKTINQEEGYCTLDARGIEQNACDASVRKKDILKVWNRIDRAHEVRFVVLTALRKFHPDYPKSNMRRTRPTLGWDKGGYVGLLPKNNRRTI